MFIGKSPLWTEQVIDVESPKLIGLSPKSKGIICGTTGNKNRSYMETISVVIVGLKGRVLRENIAVKESYKIVYYTVNI